MRRILTPLILCGALAAGCGSAELDASAESAGQPDEGGQTGSLLPGDGPQLSALELLTAMPCSLSGTSDGIEVAEGDVAVVLYPDADGTSEVRLLDAEGNELEVSVEDIDGSSAKVVRTSQALSAGEYQLELDCSDDAEGEPEATTVSVSPAAALPSNSGTLEPLFDPLEARSCSDSAWYAVRWRPSSELLAYADLLGLSASIDGQESFAVVDYGQLELSENGTLIVRFPRCNAGDSQRCLPAGQVELRLFAELPGESLQPSAASLTFRADCAPDPVDESGCAFTANGAPKRWHWPGALLTATVWRRWRRSTRRAREHHRQRGE